MSEDTPLEALLAVEIVSPAERRDRALLPVTNRALRDVKRQLADIQNVQLDALKGDPSHWQPERANLEGAVTRELTLLHREAYLAGHAAAGEIVGGRAASARVDAPDGDAAPFVSALFDEVVLTVQAGREAGHGARDLGNAVSRVYRVWRTDEAERRMRHLAGLAYHDGLLRGFADAGITDVSIQLNDDCSACAERADSGISIADTGTVPVHDECRCTIVPG